MKRIQLQLIRDGVMVIDRVMRMGEGGSLSDERDGRFWVWIPTEKGCAVWKSSKDAEHAEIGPLRLITEKNKGKNVDILYFTEKHTFTTLKDGKIIVVILTIV